MESVKFGKGQEIIQKAVILKYLNKINPFMKYIFAGIICIVLIIVNILLNVKINKISQEAKNISELNNSREQFYIEWHSRVTKENQNEHIKSLYFNYASELIRQHYQKVSSKKYRQMRPDEIYNLLDTIYNYATSNIFPSVKFPDGCFCHWHSLAWKLISILML
jgi:hypothetical protein